MTGITGGIGSGKSTIAEALAQRGYTVYDCDKEAKRIIAEDAQVRKAIIGLLGEESFADGQYNTAFVAQRVFENKALLKQLNAIVHPAVKKDITDKQPDFVESAILYEAGMDELCDRIIVVDAPEEIRIARTIARDYQSEATPDNINKVRARIQAQQAHRGDLILYNDGKTSISDLVEMVIRSMWKN